MRIATCCIILLIAACGFAPSSFAAEPPGPAPGLKLTLESGGATDVRPARLVALGVEPGAPPSPFLSPAPFKATWDGAITQRIKGDYRFAALGRGRLKVTINDAVVLDAELPADPGLTVTLKKGRNAFRAEYNSPTDGGASVRLVWIPKDVLPESVPPTVFSYDAADEKLVAQNRLRRGRELVAEHRCIKCHAADFKPESGAMPELAQDAPVLDGIGGRMNQAWLAQWIDNPQHFRPTTAMPRVFKKSAEDGNVATEAADIAAYLAADGVKADEMIKAAPGGAQEGARLFANLGCVGCHVGPNVKQPAETPNVRNPLAHVREKWKVAALIEFLKKPEQHYAWSKMPNFRLTEDEAKQLASYLNSAPELKHIAIGGDAKRGQELFQTSGCINCHATTKIQSTLRTKLLAELADFTRGCLAKDAAARGSAPEFPMTDDDRAAIAALAETKFASLKHDTPAEFAERQVATLNCVACHSRDRQDDTWSSLKDEVATLTKDLPAEDAKVEEQFAGDQSRPPLTWLGEKLRPEWAAAFIGGKVEYKPRPWLRARMPGFPARAEMLAKGQAHAHGVPFVAPPPEKPDPDLAETGRKLIARQGGFACVQCHGVGEMKAFAPFEAPAVNFVHVADRLTREYYDRWVYNPQRVQPGTRMPSFADAEGKTALKDILGGDAKKQFDAIWNYLLQGPEMKPPE